MRITASTFHLAVAISFGFLELIRSQPRTLDDLFSGYKGIMPLLGMSQTPEYQFRNFGTFHGKSLRHGSITYMWRDHIIFGYKREDLVDEPCHLFDLENLSIAFDTKKDEWITLPSYLSRALGVGRHIELLQARDEVAATLVSKPNYPVQEKAHLIACQQANARADIVEAEQSKLLKERRTTVEDIAFKIKEEYSRTYNQTFTLSVAIRKYKTRVSIN